MDDETFEEMMANKAAYDARPHQVSCHVPGSILTAIKDLTLLRRFGAGAHARQRDFPQREFILRWVLEGLARDAPIMAATAREAHKSGDFYSGLERVEKDMVDHLECAVKEAREMADAIGRKHRLRARVRAHTRSENPNLAEMAKRRRAKLEAHRLQANSEKERAF